MTCLINPTEQTTITYSEGKRAIQTHTLLSESVTGYALYPNETGFYLIQPKETYRLFRFRIFSYPFIL